MADQRVCRFSHSEILQWRKISRADPLVFGKRKQTSCALMTLLFIAHCSLFVSWGRCGWQFSYFFSKPDDVSPESVSTEGLTEVFWRDKEKKKSTEFGRWEAEIKSCSVAHWLLEFNWHFILHSFNIDQERSSQLASLLGSSETPESFHRTASALTESCCHHSERFVRFFLKTLTILSTFESAPLCCETAGGRSFQRRSPLVRPMAAPHLFYGTKTWTKINKTELRRNSLFYLFIFTFFTSATFAVVAAITSVVVYFHKSNFQQRSFNV